MNGGHSAMTSPIARTIKPVLLAELHALRADGELGVERSLGDFVTHELARADEADAARLADEGMRGERREPRLELRRDARRTCS